MTPYQFFPIFMENFDTYLYVLLVACLIYCFVIQRLCFNVFDPLFFLLVGSLFSFSMVVFLFEIHYIDGKYLFEFLITELSFVFGLLFFSCSKQMFYKRCINAWPSYTPSDLSNVKIIFLVSLFLYFLSVVIDYSISGIPAFRDSRQGAYVGSGGLGIIERFNYISSYGIAFGIVYLYLYRHRELSILWRVAIPIVLFMFCLTLLLSGSRSRFLILPTSWFYLYYFYFVNRRSLLGWKSNHVGFFCGIKGFLVILVSACLSLLVVYVSSRKLDISFLDVAGVVLYRIVNFGDCFLYAYINDGVNYIRGDSSFVGLLGGFLSVFRLFPSDDLYVPMGIQLAKIVDPNMSFIAGPNPRHNIMGIHFFGVAGGVLFSFVCGAWVSFIRNSSQRLFCGGILKFFTLFLLIESTGQLFVDFQFSMSKFSSLIIVSFLYITAIFLIPKVGRRGA